MVKKIYFSIVVPVFNEKKNLELLTSRLMEVSRDIGKSFEIIFIDDGSNDGSSVILEKIHNRSKRVKVIQFRRNFGKTPALMAGFELAKGDIILTMDADLQNDPNDIPRFIKKIEEGYDVVNGWRSKRIDPFSKTFPSKIYNWLARLVTDIEMHDFNCGFKAFKKEVLKNFNLYGEMHRYIPVFLAAQGYKLAEIKVLHHPRKFGKSKYGFLRILKGFLDLLYVKFWLDFSTRPIHFLGGVGFILYFLAAIIFIEQIIKAIIIKVFFVGPLLTLAVLLVTTGTLCILFGFLAEIQIRTYYTQSKDKTFAIKNILK